MLDGPSVTPAKAGFQSACCCDATHAGRPVDSCVRRNDDRKPGDGLGFSAECMEGGAFLARTADVQSAPSARRGARDGTTDAHR